MNIGLSGVILLTALAPMIWGSTYIVTTELLPADMPFTAACIRVLPAGLLLVLYSRNLPKVNELGKLLVLAGLNIGFFQALLFVAAYRLPGGIAAVLGALQPIMVMGFIWLCDQKRPAVVSLIAAIFGVLGMAVMLISPNGHWDLIGILAAFFGAMFMALGTFLSQRWQNSMPLLGFTGWQLLLGGLMLLPISLLLDPPMPELGISELLSFSYLSLFGALLAYVIWFRGLSKLPSVAVSSLGLLSPISAVILGWVFLDQALSGGTLFGMIVVLLSVLIVQLATVSIPKISIRKFVFLLKN